LRARSTVETARTRTGYVIGAWPWRTSGSRLRGGFGPPFAVLVARCGVRPSSIASGSTNTLDSRATSALTPDVKQASPREDSDNRLAGTACRALSRRLRALVLLRRPPCPGTRRTCPWRDQAPLVCRPRRAVRIVDRTLTPSFIGQAHASGPATARGQHTQRCCRKLQDE
jgi:hypothetical protein